MRIKKADLEFIIRFFKDRFIDFEQQRLTAPNHVVNDYISWLHSQWDSGIISLPEYRKLIQIDILTA